MRNSRQDGIYSQEYIMDAIQKLLADHKFQDITVTDVCKKAGVARVTFYKYYRTIYEVIQAAADIKIKSFLGKINNIKSDDDLKMVIECILEEINAGRPSLKNLVDSNMSGMLLDFFNYGLDEIVKSNALYGNYLGKTKILFLAGGLFNITLDWIKEDSNESPQSVAARIYEAFPYK